MAKNKPGRIWCLDWYTESGDRGQIGYWAKRPSEKAQARFIQENFPYEFPGKNDGQGPGPGGGYIYWSLDYFDLQEPM